MADEKVVGSEAEPQEPQEQTPPPEPQEPQEQTPPPEPQATGEEPEPQGPWAKDLVEAFDDPAVRTEVDKFLRGTVQPHVTQLEQATKGNRDAEALWNDFRDNPVNTFLAVSGELFGDDVSQDLAKVLSEINENPEPTPDQAAEQQSNIDSLPPEVQEVVRAHQDKQRADSYKDALDELKEQHKDDEDAYEIDEDLIHPFIVAADGDFEVAYAGYQEWASQANERLGLKPPDPNDVEGENEEEVTPPVIGSDTRTPGTPPVEKKYESLDEAIDDFIAEQHSPPPTV